MRNQRRGLAGVLGIAVGLAGAWVASGAVNLDLSDFDDDLMRGLDDTVKALDSDISAHDVKAIATDARSIRDGLKWAQDYFTRKGNLEDATRWAKQGQELSELIVSSAQSGDFDTSADKYESLVKTCRACHDVYKPPDI